MSSIRALTNPRRANSARAAATRASLALGSAGLAMSVPLMTDGSETVRLFLTRGSETVNEFLTYGSSILKNLNCFLADARQVASRQLAPHLAGRLGEVRDGVGGKGRVAGSLLGRVRR